MGIVRFSLVISLVAATGCYRWVPIEGTAVPIGADVRVRLTDQGSDDLRRSINPSAGFVVGPLASSDDESVSVLVVGSLSRPGFPPTVLTDTVRVPLRYVASLDGKELDGKRTAGLSVGIAGAVAALILATRALGGDTDPGEGQGPPVDASIRIGLPLGIR